MSIKERACAMRADRAPFDLISRTLGISLGHAYRVAGDVVPEAPQGDATTVVRYYSNNDGYPQPVRMPRIAALHGVAA